mmetsp:Transcript_81988/g.163281  ORF Transcript_81988/g.163281 Transcript_81988/m.163281 type:complete len:205 (+) Transcript_81988:238-852(+)
MAGTGMAPFLRLKFEKPEGFSPPPVGCELSTDPPGAARRELDHRPMGSSKDIVAITSEENSGVRRGVSPEVMSPPSPSAPRTTRRPSDSSKSSSHPPVASDSPQTRLTPSCSCNASRSLASRFRSSSTTAAASASATTLQLDDWRGTAGEGWREAHSVAGDFQLAGPSIVGAAAPLRAPSCIAAVAAPLRALSCSSYCEQCMWS